MGDMDCLHGLRGMVGCRGADAVTPINTALDRVLADQETRHAWLFRAGEQARRFNEESRIENEEYNRERSS